MKFNPNFNPYQNQQNNNGSTNPYAQPMNNNSYMQAVNNNPMLSPAPLPGSTTEQGYYPSSYSQVNLQQPQPNEYKSGGKVKGKAKSRESLPDLAERLRSQGRNGDTVLAHINPLEARLLKSLGGSGTKNPKTGQPEFFFRGIRNFFRNPGKTIKKSFKNPKRTIADIIGTLGAIYGGPMGGAIAGATRSAIRGDKENPLIGALKGAGYAYGANTAANLAGQGLSKLGAEGIGQSLQNHAAANSGWMGSLGNIGKSSTNGSDAFSVLDKAGKSTKGLGVAAGDSAKDALPSLDSLKEAAERKYYSNYVNGVPFKEKVVESLTDPKNLIALGSAGLSAYSMLKKPKSPEEIANEQKRFANAKRLSLDEIEGREKYFSDVDNIRKQYEQNRMRYKKGGEVLKFSIADLLSDKSNKVRSKNLKPKVHATIIEESMIIPKHLKGETGGQDDRIPAMLSDGEYVMDASTVSDLGDGNNAAGARMLDRMRHNIRKHKRGGKMSLPPKAKSLIDYLR